MAAKPGGPEAPETEAPQGISELIEVLSVTLTPVWSLAPVLLRQVPLYSAQPERERERHPQQEDSEVVPLNQSRVP